MTPRILVIRGGAIGDFVLTLPAIKMLRDQFPRAHLEILGYKHILVLAERRFYAHAARSIEYGALAGFFVPGSDLAPELVDYFSGFQQIISYLYDPDGLFESNLRRCGVKHYLAASPKLDDSEHASRQLARPLERLALYLEKTAAELHPSHGDRRFAAQFLADARAPVVALHPGSGSERKNWPIEKWIELARRVAGIAGDIVIVAGEADLAGLAALREALSGARVLIAQDLALNHLAAVLGRCAVFVGHDSGISHIAAAVETPCVLLFGPTDPDIWAPANAGVRVVRHPSLRMEEIEVDAVVENFGDALAAGR
jgi:heptosyltransferase-2